MSTAACDQRCISNVGEDGGCDEYIDLKAWQVPPSKSGGLVGGRRSAVGG
jgi:hypothetical protein